MGDRITWFEDCPNCGKKNSLECYEALSSNMKTEDCENCGLYISYDFDESDPHVIKMKRRVIRRGKRTAPSVTEGSKDE